MTIGHQGTMKITPLQFKMENSVACSRTKGKFCSHSFDAICKRISALGGKQGKNMHRLCLANMKTNRRMVQALVDTIALHNFMRTSLARIITNKIVIKQ